MAVRPAARRSPAVGRFPAVSGWLAAASLAGFALVALAARSRPGTETGCARTASTQCPWPCSTGTAARPSPAGEVSSSIAAGGGGGVIAWAISSPVGSTRSVHSAATATEASEAVGGGAGTTGGAVLLALISAVAFATILAVVAGLTLTSASSVAHDLYANVWKRGTASEKDEVKMARVAAFIIGGVAIALAIPAQKVNIAFLVALAFAVAASANTGGDVLTSNHVRNWMECVRSRQQPHAPVEAGYSHSIANIMTTAAAHTGLKATFDEKTQEVMVGGKVFKY